MKPLVTPATGMMPHNLFYPHELELEKMRPAVPEANLLIHVIPQNVFIL
jgi:hypothetical protein